jgi:GNAT superfamily N-acetyltransferase
VSDSGVLIDESQRIRNLFYEQVRRGTTSDGLSIVSASPHFVRWTASGEVGWSEIAWSDLDETTADQVITEQIDHFATIDQDVVWRVYEDDLPTDLSTRLASAGFEHIGTSELMIARVADTATGVELPDGVTLVRANDSSGIRQLIEVHAEVFDVDQTQLGRTLLAQLSVAPLLNELVVAVANGTPVSSARVQFVPDCDFAGLWGGSTLPQWRGKGLFKAMVAYRARVAAERGYNFLYVIASSQSRPILEHLAFESFGSIATFRWQPAAS